MTKASASASRAIRASSRVTCRMRPVNSPRRRASRNASQPSGAPRTLGWRSRSSRVASAPCPCGRGLGGEGLAGPVVPPPKPLRKGRGEIVPAPQPVPTSRHWPAASRMRRSIGVSSSGGSAGGRSASRPGRCRAVPSPPPTRRGPLRRIRDVSAHETADHQVVLERPAMRGSEQQASAPRVQARNGLVQSSAGCHIAVPLYLSAREPPSRLPLFSRP